MNVLGSERLFNIVVLFGYGGYLGCSVGSGLLVDVYARRWFVFEGKICYDIANDGGLLFFRDVEGR